MTRKTKSRNVTNAALVLDASSSMASVRDAAFKVFNQLVGSVASSVDDADSTLDIFTFATGVQHLRRYYGYKTNQAWELKAGEYRPCGSTALLDATGFAIEKLSEYPAVKSPNATRGKLVMVVTDGEENCSVRWNARRLKSEIERLQDTGEWTFVFQVPRGGYRDRLCRQFGIPAENVAEWEATEAGTYELYETTSAGIGTYYQARAGGQCATKNFFATTDLSGVTSKAVHKKLQDLSSHFKLYDVPQEWEVKAFVESKTRKNYVTGQAYYLLVKPEKVQADKSLLLMEKGKREVWGGDEARRLAGIPVGVDVRVVPGNHAAYDVFVESRSHNRKLPRGSKVLIDVTQTTPRTPTWIPTPTT